MLKVLTNFIFVDQKTNTISHTKAFSVLGYLMLCAAFIYHTVTQQPIDANLWTLFCVTVIGNRSINKIMSKKKESSPVG